MARDKIEVTWVDSHTRSGWDSVDNSLRYVIDELDLSITTIGYKFHETDDILVTVMSQGEPDLVNALNIIPKVAITKIRKLK